MLQQARLGQQALEREVQRLRTLLPGEWDLIAETVLTGSVASVTFSSIPDKYRTLVLANQVRTDRVSEADTASLRFNGDSGNNYDTTLWLLDGGGTHTVATARATNLMWVGSSEAASSRASNFAPSWVLMVGYSLTDREKQVFSPAGSRLGNRDADADLRIGMYLGAWRSTAAVTSLTILPNTGPNWVSGCRFTLYGVL